MTEAEKRIREAFSRPTLIEREDVRTLLAEIDLLRERQFSADMCLDAVHEARRVLREHFGGNLAFLDDDLVRGVVKMKEEIDRLTRERDALAKDAERYRWLRGDLCPDHSVRWAQWEVRCWRAPFWTGDLRREELDGAIDDALRRAKDAEARG